jgi:hypothetical protein
MALKLLLENEIPAYIFIRLFEIATMYIQLSTFHFTTYSFPVYEKEVPCIILGSEYIYLPVY